MEGDEEVTKHPKLAKELQKCIPKKEILISEISLWEIAMLSSKGRIQIAEPLEDWLEEVLKAPGIRAVNLTPKILADSVHLPGAFHADPSDRLIVSTARVLGAQLVTKDHLIQKYAKTGNVKVFPSK